MIQINIISRVSEDKNFFFDVIYAIHKLQQVNINDVEVLIIGDIITKTLYNDLLKLIDLFNLSDQIGFTKHSIRFEDLPEHVKNGYFLNFTIGNFKGYSGIESIKMGFKTIFYNVDKGLSIKTEFSESQCADITSLINLFSKISTDTKSMDQLILEDNLRMRNEFILSSGDGLLLRSILTPRNTPE
jgi:hypothetical protein